MFATFVGRVVAQTPAASSAGRAGLLECQWRVEWRGPGELHAIAPIGRSEAWAVGYSFDKSGIAHPRALHHIGRRWRSVRVPTNNGPYVLQAVAFASANMGWAVGTGLPTDAIENWDGRHWSVAHSANLGERGAWLNDIAVLRNNDVWVAGMSTPPGNGGGGRALIEHWDGVQWIATAFPDVGQSQFLAIAGVSNRDVWAVGKQIDHTLLAHWDGRNWQVIPTAVAPLGALVDIDAVSSHDVWVVGSQGGPWPAPSRPLVLHWDGRSWQRIPAPVGDAYAMTSIVTISSREIWISAASERTIVIKRFLGNTWHGVKVPRWKGADELVLSATARKNDVWAVMKNYPRDAITHFHC
jgi:photosystem II stability/assembly factor-like uncharacterized protein